MSGIIVGAFLPLDERAFFTIPSEYLDANFAYWSWPRLAWSQWSSIGPFKYHLSSLVNLLFQKAFWNLHENKNSSNFRFWEFKIQMCSIRILGWRKGCSLQSCQTFVLCLCDGHGVNFCLPPLVVFFKVWNQYWGVGLGIYTHIGKWPLSPKFVKVFGLRTGVGVSNMFLWIHIHFGLLTELRKNGLKISTVKASTSCLPQKWFKKF